MPFSPNIGAEALPLAYDRMGSVRTLDEDGRLKVKQTNLSKACINPYRGSEIPNWEGLGLDPHKIYRLLRCPKALEDGASSFDCLPVLLEHVHVSARNPRHDLVVGATGSNSVFQAPYLANSLSIWDQNAIDKINQEEQKELSCAYRYIPQMQSGTYQGEAYDGIMTNIRGNHVALVKKGRAGPDVLVADASPYENDALFPIIQAWRPFCPHATDREIRLVVAKVIGELTALPEHADFLPSVPLWAQETITQDSNPNHLPKGSPNGGEFASKTESGLSISIIPQQNTVKPKATITTVDRNHDNKLQIYKGEPYDFARHHEVDLQPLFDRNQGHFSVGSKEWLQSHENVNGSHTILKHVGQSVGDMKRRFRFDPKLKATGSFPDEETAAKTIWKAIQDNQDKILKGIDRKSKKIELAFDAGHPIGKVLENNGGKITEETNRVKIILHPDRQGKYLIHTAYPTL